MRTSTRLTRAAVLASLATVAAAQGNVLLLIGDDIGVDRVGAYNEHPDPGRTPVLDSLAAQGVLFRNAWANPLCSPTRAEMLTGRYGFRTGIGMAIQEQFPWPGLALNEVSLPEALGPTYHSEVLGKWHLATPAQGGLHPLSSGFEHHRGSMFNLVNYFSWPKSVDGSVTTSNTYATTDTVNDAIQLVQNMPEPWFLWVALNAPHGPIHAPPPELHTYQLSGNPSATTVVHVKAMIEAMDTELGRLLAVVDSNTTIIFVGDNGTFGGAIDAPFDPNHGKGTLYEGGVNVPLIIAGPKVAFPGSECNALVDATDLFATILEIARPGSAPAPVGRVRSGSPGPPPPIHPASPSIYVPPPPKRDSISMVPYLAAPLTPSLRTTVYAERFLPNGRGPYTSYDRAMRGARYKLIEHLPPARDELYDLLNDPFEQTNLLDAVLTPEQDAAYVELKDAMVALLAS